MKRRRSAWSFWAAVGCAAPATYFSSFAGGAPVAEACPSEATLPDGVRNVSVFASSVTIGRDGFFVAAASGYDLTAEAFGTVRVEVRDAAGELVPGELELLRNEDRERPDTDVLWLGWTASAMLQTGARLTLRVSVPSAMVSTEAELTVADESAALALPQFEFTTWRGLFVDTGPKLTCTPKQPGWCFPIEFGTNAESVLEASLQTNELSGLPVAGVWEYSVSEVAGKGALVEPLEPYLRLKHDLGPEVIPFRLRFRDELDEYCVKLTVQDLHTEESLSETYCGAPPEFVEEVDLDAVKGCQSVPHEYLPRWCQGRDPNVDASCRDPIVGMGGGAGTTGGVGAGGASGGTAPGSAGTHSSAGSGVASPGDDDDHHDSATSQVVSQGCGCRLAPHATEREGWLSLAGLGVLGLVWACRRAREENR